MVMSQPPFRSRPNLRLALTDLTGSPRQSAQSTPPPTSRFITPYPTPENTPFAKTAYSPYYSAGLKAPAIYGTPESFTSFTPRRASRSCYRNYNSYRFKRFFASKPAWLLLMVFALALWWINGGSEEINVVKFGASSLGKDFLQERRMHDYQFYPATNPKIHVSRQCHSRLVSLTGASTLAAGHPRLTDCARMEHFQVFYQRLLDSHKI